MLIKRAVAKGGFSAGGSLISQDPRRFQKRWGFPRFRRAGPHKDG
jgi:hypothetical protein